MTSRDRALFDDRPARPRACPRCNGCGTIDDGYALAPGEPFEGAPVGALHAFVVGSSDVFESCREAVALAGRARRPVAFEFNGQVVVARAGDDPDAIARAWWQRAYNETPEATRARR